MDGNTWIDPNLVTIIQMVVAGIMAILTAFFPKVMKSIQQGADRLGTNADKVDVVSEKLNVAVDHITNPVQLFKAKIADGQLTKEEIEELVESVNAAEGPIKDLMLEFKK